MCKKKAATKINLTYKTRWIHFGLKTSPLNWILWPMHAPITCHGASPSSFQAAKIDHVGGVGYKNRGLSFFLLNLGPFAQEETQA